MKKGFKGFNHDLTCGLGSATKEQFEFDKVYTKETKDNPRLCSSDGYHYCNELKDVFDHYKPVNGNRFCEIEILGPFTDGGNKSITTSFKIIRELSHDEAFKIRYDENLNINLVKEIQTKFPYFHVGGSVGLYLHGVRLQRWANKRGSDIDMVAPFFVLPEGEIDGEDIEYYDAKASANDFDETFRVGNVKVDYRIDPKQRYELIEYDGFKFKVSPLLVITEAKMRYAMLPNGQKHKKDLEEMILSKKPGMKKTETEFPF
jgi:hypothetical protein